MEINGYHIVRSIKDACALYCPQCEQVWHKLENPYWGINKTKGLHESGSGHKTYYIAPHPQKDLG